MVATRNLVFAMEHIDAVLSSKLECFLWKNALFREVIRDLRFPIITVKRKQSIDGFHQWQLSEGMEYFLIQASILYPSFRRSNHPSSSLPISTARFCFEMSCCRLRDKAKFPYYVFAKKFAGFYGFTCFSHDFEFSLAKANILPFFANVYAEVFANIFTFSFVLTRKSSVKTKMNFWENPKTKSLFWLYFRPLR